MVNLGETAVTFAGGVGSRPCGPELTEEDLVRLQKELSVQFPDQLLDLYGQQNGAYFDVPLCFSTPFLEPHDTYARLQALMAFRAFDDTEDILTYFPELEYRLGKSRLPLGTDDGGNFICVELTGPNVGKIVFCDFMASDGFLLVQFHEVAPDLNAFLDLLRPMGPDE